MKGKPPLEGVKVLDFSTYTPGPFGTQILADLGATVLKIEKPGVGDPERAVHHEDRRRWLPSVGQCGIPA